MMQETLQGMMRDWWRDIKNDKYTLSFLAALLFVLLAVGGWKAKQWYVASQEGAAQLVFSEALDEYDRVLYAIKKGTAEKQQWDDAAFGFKTVEDKGKGTTYAVYSQAFQADVQARQGNFDQALNLLGQAIAQMGDKSPGYYLFKTKMALLQLDAGKTEQALGDLQQLADDQDNPNNDTAAFFLGYYYWAKDKFNLAKKAWDRFDKSKQPTNSEKISPWAQIAQVKLSQIT
jgi:predicted negative regulator of RcsB-dependent stress response